MLKKLLVLFALVVWIYISWNWYVCGIKGFCAAKNPVQATQEEGMQKYIATNTNGECDEYIKTHLKRGANNNVHDVQLLTDFLNDYEGENLLRDDVYDVDDEAAVKRFQRKYRKEVLDPWGINQPTGHVYQTTRSHINKLHCNKY